MAGFNADPPTQIAINIFLPLVATILVALRFILRTARKVGLGIDDWLCLPSLIFTWACAAVIFWGVGKRAVGYHSPPQEDLDEFKAAAIEVQTIIHKANILFTFFAYFALGSAKLSALFFYRRVFRGPLFNIVSWTFITVVFLWMWVFALVWIFSCGGHFDFLWGTLDDIENRCLNIFAQWIGGAAVDFIMDFFILFLPAVMVWQLQMSKERKLAVIAIFSTGTISVLFGILHFFVTEKLAFLQIHLTHGSTLGVPNTDQVYLVSIVLLLAMVEVSIALVTICLPTLYTGTLFHGTLRVWLARIGLGSRGASGKNQYGSNQYATHHAAPRTRTRSRPSDRDSGEHSETELNGIGYKMDFRVESQARSRDDYAGGKRRYDDLFPPASVRVEATPKESV